MNNYIYIAVMAAVSYTIRVLPLGYRKQSGTEPCGDDTGNECHQSGNGGLGSMDDGREGHDGQRHVRYIVQKGLNKLILDGFTDQCQG